MNKIEEMIEKFCPEGVEYKELGEVCEFNRGKSITSKEITDGKYPVVAGGINPQFYHNEFNRNENTITVAGSGANAGFINFWEIPIFCSDSFSVDIKNIEELKSKYVFYFLKNNQNFIYSKKSGGGIPHVYGKDLKTIKIPIPPIEIQEKIVEILDKFTALTAELTAELTARKKQYEYYRDKLLTFGDEVKWKELGEVCDYYDGTHQTPKYTDKGVPFISVENIKDIYNTEKYISVEDFNKFKIKPKKNDLFMTRIGDIGTCSVFEKDYDLGYYVTLSLIRPKTNDITTKYLKYIIESTHGKKELNKRILHNAVPIKINLGDIGKIKIPIPPLEKQKEIVEILDKFDTLCNSLTEGLPKEIELREKQYEYYRDKLLSFKEKIS